MFKIDIETGATCGGPMKVIASLEEPALSKRILAPLDNHSGKGQHPEHPPRAPPQLTLPGLLEQAVDAATRTDAKPVRP